MAKTTIPVSLGSGADDEATSGKISVRRVYEGADGDMLVLSAWKDYPVGPGLQLVVTAGELYQSREDEPRGRTRYWYAPEVTTNYADLEDVYPIPVGESFGPQGPQGEPGEPGAQGEPGPNSIPTAEFVGQISGIIVTSDAEADALPEGAWAIVLGTPAPSDSTPPTTPTALVATPGNGKVTLSWGASTDNVGGLEYVVRRDGSVVSTQVGLSFVDTGRTNGTLYSYTVAAVDGAGNTSTPTTAVTATPAPTAPAQITNLVATSNGGGSYTLTVTPPDNGGSAITDYVYESRVGAGSWTVYADGTSSTPTATLTGLATSDITFRAAAVNAVGAGPASASVEPRVNLLTPNQASVETDTTGFVVGNTSTTISRSTADKKSGVASLLLTQATSGGLAAYVEYSGVVPGQTYTGLVSTKNVSAALSEYVNLVWLTSSNTSAGSNTSGAITPGSTSAFVDLAVSGVAPATAAKVRVQFGIPSATSPAVGPAAYADEIGLFKGVVPAGGWVPA